VKLGGDWAGRAREDRHGEWLALHRSDGRDEKAGDHGRTTFHRTVGPPGIRGSLADWLKKLATHIRFLTP
jgi:hypothetical protein